MNMSRTVIYTKLKALTGQNLSTFIRLIRLKKASRLITETQMNVSQVAYEVGFNDLKYFRESFKELYKVTPSEYKKQQQKSRHQEQANTISRINTIRPTIAQNVVNIT